MTRPLITVFGATGAQGGGLAAAILGDPARRFALRAVTRRPDSPPAQALAQAGAEVVAADLDDEPSVRRAMRGAHGAFCMTSSWEHHSPERELRQAHHLARAVRDAGVRHAVWSTLEDTRDFVPAGAGPLAPAAGRFNVPCFDVKGEANHAFVASGVPMTFLYTPLRWECLAQPALAPRRGPLGHLALRLPTGQAKLPGIAAADIGRCAYGLFGLGEDAAGKSVGIAGEHLTAAQMAEQLALALGEPVAHLDLPPEPREATGFAGADELAAMLRFHRHFERACCEARSVACAKELNPRLLSFAGWLALHKARLALALGLALPLASGAGAPAIPPLPASLHDTGLYEPGTTTVRAGNLAFAPQYPLWTDGAAKRRWIRLPAGGAIDASRPDAWEFPRGTRLWKEFAFGRPIETRYIERLADGSWRFATYVWNEAGTAAALAPDDGIDAHPAKGAPGGRYAIPSRTDCLACHEGPSVPVLGFSALQLSPDRDPLAPHAQAPRPGHENLSTLAQRGLLRDLPAALLEKPPRIAAADATARAALGYLHGNCGHCHNDGALGGVELSLAQKAAAPRESAELALASLVGHASRFRPREAAAVQRVVPGHPESSVLVARLKTTNPSARMPPLGVQVADREGIGLVERWIREVLPSTRHLNPE
jgi:mono/diheme cytochrome c family protein